jgi:hypothetical protein
MPELDAFGDPIGDNEELQDPAALSEEGSDPEGEEEASGDDKRSKFIPRERFDEVNNRAIQASQEVEALRAQLYQMAPLVEQVLRQQNQQPQGQGAPEIDRDVFEKLKPYLDADSELTKRELAYLRNVVTELAVKTEAHRGWEYIASEVPDWKQLAPEIIKYVESLPKNLQKAFREDPESMVFAANEVRKAVNKGKNVVEGDVRDSLKNRAHSEGGSSGVRGNSKVIDYNGMSSADFKKVLDRIENARAVGYIPPDDSW